MPRRRGLVPVKAVQQYSVSLSSFRDLLGIVRWCSGNFIALVFVNVASEKRGEIYLLL